jgi:hypothetical protein
VPDRLGTTRKRPAGHRQQSSQRTARGGPANEAVPGPVSEGLAGVASEPDLGGKVRAGGEGGRAGPVVREGEREVRAGCPVRPSTARP